MLAALQQQRCTKQKYRISCKDCKHGSKTRRRIRHKINRGNIERLSNVQNTVRIFDSIVCISQTHQIELKTNLNDRLLWPKPRFKNNGRNIDGLW